MDRKNKYTLFPIPPPSSAPSEPLPPFPDGQLRSPLAHTAFPRPPSRRSPIKPHATSPSLPLQELPPQPHLALSSQGSRSQQPHASSSSPHPPLYQPNVSSRTEQGPSPYHFDPAFPPPLPNAPPPLHSRVVSPPSHSPEKPLRQHPKEPLTPPAELEANNPWPSLNNSWPQHEESTPSLKDTAAPTESTPSPRKTMHTPTLSASTSSSESSLHKPANIVAPSSSQTQNNATNSRPRTVYFHSGLGGAGNYHKAIREDNVLKPMVGNRSNHPRFLSSLFGTLGGKRGRRQQQQQYNGSGSGNSSDGTGSRQSSSQTLPLGAAEVMRRKMLGLDGKTRSKS